MHRENDKIERYKTYLRLEKALSANSIDAYLTDLDKLTNFVESEGKKYADVTYDDLQQFVARLHDIGIHPRCLLYTSPSPRDAHESRMPSSA